MARNEQHCRSVVRCESECVPGSTDFQTVSNMDSVVEVSAGYAMLLLLDADAIVRDAQPIPTCNRLRYIFLV
jgi:hypothetical protein